MIQKGDKERQNRERSWMKFIRKRNNTVTRKSEKNMENIQEGPGQIYQNPRSNKKTKMNKMQFNL